MEKTLKKFLTFFLIIQPLLDIYILYDPKVVDIFGFSPSTIIRIIFFGILSLLLLINRRSLIKSKWIITYILLVILYCVLHHYNALNFTSLVPGNFNYSIKSELFYIIRMLMPLGMIIISFNSDFKDDRLEKVISYLTLFITGSIVITNILGFSLGSYNNLQIKSNIFSWFTNGYEITDYLGLASKGFFNFANAIAALCVLLTPILLYVFIKKPTIKNQILIIIQFLGMYMLGTKVSTYGFIILIIGTLFIYLFFSIIKKEIAFNKKIIITISLVTITSLIILPYTPTMNRKQIDNELIDNPDFSSEKIKEIQERAQDELKTKILNVATLIENQIDNYSNKLKTFNYNGQKYVVNRECLDNLLISYIDENYKYYNIHPYFIEQSYPFQYDPYFWFNVMNQTLEYRLNFRFIEKDMLNQVKKINNNKYDEIFGITFSRVSNIFNLERDFISHFYTLGMLGLLIFISPYLILLLIVIFKMLKNYNNLFNFKNVMFTLSVSITIFAAYYSGNVLDALVVTFILSFVYGQLIKSVFNNSNNKDSKISILIPSYNDSDTIMQTIKSIEKQTYSNYEVIIIDDGSTDSTKTIISKYNKNSKKKVKYLYQENSDQLNAIKKGMDSITGDLIMILHSDDILADRKTLQYSVDYFNNNEKVDAIISDLPLINDNYDITGYERTNEFRNSKCIPPTVLLWLGRNIYKDTTIIKKEKFFNQYKDNYLDWNMPFWIYYDENVKMLNVKKVYFPLIRYRIHEKNYINDNLGKLNVLNGELRTATRLLKFYDIPYYNLQYKIYRIFNKLKLNNIYCPIYFNKENSDKGLIVENIISKRINNYREITYLNSIIQFYKKNSNRKIVLDLSKMDKVYFGSDMRNFNKLILENNLPKFYTDFIKEIEKGFNTIVVEDKYYEKAITLLKFFCIYPYVEVNCNPEGKTIPKKIHYVWVGGKEKPKSIQRCIKTWEKLEGYEIIEWNEDNFDMDSHLFTKKAYAAKKWAFVSDYIRAYVIYNYGGIYFDTDIFVIRNIDQLLNNRAFVGYENSDHPFTAVFGAEAGHPLVKDMLDYYNDAELKFDFKNNNTISVSDLLIKKYNCKTGNIEQILQTGIKVYTDDMICNPSEQSLTVHAFLGSWLENTSLKNKLHAYIRVRLSNKFIIALYCRLYKNRKSR